MKISELDPVNKKLALEYKINAVGFDKQTDDLEFAFYWEDTEEGYKYWNKLHCAILIENDKTTDTIVLSVMDDLNERSLIGIKKYGVTLDREDLSRKDWLIHAYEETLDKALYLKKLISLE